MRALEFAYARSRALVSVGARSRPHAPAAAHSRPPVPVVVRLCPLVSARARSSARAIEIDDRSNSATVQCFNCVKTYVSFAADSTPAHARACLRMLAHSRACRCVMAQVSACFCVFAYAPVAPARPRSSVCGRRRIKTCETDSTFAQGDETETMQRQWNCNPHVAC